MYCLNVNFPKDENEIKGFKITRVGYFVDDLEMIEYAGLGVAMANSQECLKEVADKVTEKTVKEVGVYYFLCKFFNLNPETLEEN